MDFPRTRVRFATQPQPRYVRDDDNAPEGTSITVSCGEQHTEQATVEAHVVISVERCETGRCAICRDNARTRFVVKQTDAHGVKKWCGPCLAEKLSIDEQEVRGTAS